MIDPQVADLVIEAAWKSFLVAGAVLVLLALLKRRSAAERACVAHFGMAAVLLLPLAIVAGPSLELLPGRDLAPRVLAEPVPDTFAPAPSVETALLATAAAPTEAAPEEPAARWFGPENAIIFYFLPAALLLLMTMVAVLRLFALRRRANVIVQQGWLTALAHAQRRMGIKSGTALLVSEELSSPVSWGLLRPIILLSEDALDNPVDAEAIIAHELAHVARFDWLNLLVARVATGMFWFNPLVWLLARQGHQLREEAADDAVLRAEIPSTDYAALLVGAARHEGKSMLLAANGVAPRKGSLSLRVRRILEPTCPRRPVRFAWGAGCAAGAVLIAGPLAALTQHTPRPPSLAHAPAAPAAPAPPAAPAIAALNMAPPAPGAAAAPPPAPAAAPLAIASAVAPGALAAAPTAASPAAPAAAPPPATPVTPSAPIPPETLVSMRVHGVTSESHAEYAEAYPRLRKVSPDQLVSLKVHNVTPSRLREYTQLGYGNLDCNRIIEWAVHGVTPNFIRSLAAEGYAGLTPGQLTEFRVMGVTPNFIKQVKQAGLGSLSPSRLVDLSVQGFTRAPGPRSRGTPPGVPRPRPAPNT
jgi:beta-lactamase regulating signal transducer with metallopeptidase domain